MNTQKIKTQIWFLYTYTKILHINSHTSGILCYCEIKATFFPTKEIAYKINNILKLLDICQSTILNEELSIIRIISDRKKPKLLLETFCFKPTFQISKYTTKRQQKFLTMFNFQHSQITQKEFEQLAELLLKYPMVYASSKFNAQKVNSTLNEPLKLDAIFKKQ